MKIGTELMKSLALRSRPLTDRLLDQTIPSRKRGHDLDTYMETH